MAPSRARGLLLSTRYSSRSPIVTPKGHNERKAPEGAFRLLRPAVKAGGAKRSAFKGTAPMWPLC
jgi:hypothetical protein